MSKVVNLNEIADDGELMELSMGPQHPSTHGVLRLNLKLRGEVAISAEPDIGYLHTGIEKECETRTYLQTFTLIDRLDYLSGPAEEHCYAAAVEKLMNIEVPERAQVIRVILLELARIGSHLLCTGTGALELNMSSVYMYAFAEREKILDILEGISGARMFPSLWRIGGLAKDADPHFEASVKRFCKEFKECWTTIDSLLSDNYVWVERLEGVAIIDKNMCEQYMCTGPVLRAAGVAYDIRKAYPYSGYEHYKFEVPTLFEADSYARYKIRMLEMLESISIIEQAMARLKPGLYINPDRKVALPKRSELVRSMEAVIHQFKLVSEGIHPPAGDVCFSVESARGELQYYLTSDGSNKPYRLRVRSPSFAHVQVLKEVLKGHIISDIIVGIASVDPIMGDVDR